MVSLIAERVASRYVRALASQKLPGMVKDVIDAVHRERYEDAYEKYDKFLRAIGIKGAPKGDTIRVESEWSFNMTPSERHDYDKWLKDLVDIRRVLQRAAYLPPGEMPQVGDVEWDLGIIQHNFIAWVEPFFRDSDDEFKHGPFQVILADDAKQGLDEALKTLDLATAKIASKFAKVLYGKVFVTRGLKGGTYAAPPSRAGSYVAATDSINLSLYAVPDRDSVMTLIHEFGHRYHTRFLSGEDREKFIQLSTVGDFETLHFPLAERKQLVDEYIERQRHIRDDDAPARELSERGKLFFYNYPRDAWKAKAGPLLTRFQNGDDAVEEKLREALGMYQYGGNLSVETNAMTREPLSASPYGATGWQENFAECFLHFCVGKALPPPLQKFMADL